MPFHITKRFGPYPFAHRQPNHDGHCRWVHGHNWYFDITFAATTLDVNGFVWDFGNLGVVKGYLTSNFDHTLVLNTSDPELLRLRHSLGALGLANVVDVPNCGAEGLAKFLLEQVNLLLRTDLLTKTDANTRDVRCVRVTAIEDEKNSATYEP